MEQAVWLKKVLCQHFARFVLNQQRNFEVIRSENDMSERKRVYRFRANYKKSNALI